MTLEKKRKVTIFDKTPEKKTRKYSPKRTEAQKSDDRTYIMDKYLKGYSYREISAMISKSEGRKYSLSHAAVGDDVKHCLDEWKKERDSMVDMYLTVELQKIDKLELEYWDAWDKSKLDHQEKSAKIVKRKGSGKNEEIGGVITNEETSVKHLTEFGDPRFLQGIERCIQKRIDLLGLESAKKLNIEYDDITDKTIFRVKPKALEAHLLKKVV